MLRSGTQRQWRVEHGWTCVVASLHFYGMALIVPAAAQDASPQLVVGNAEGGVSFNLVTTELTSNEIQIFNGTSPTSGDWRSILVASFPPLDAAAPNVRDGTCTAVLVGRHVLLTAAHCVHRRPGKQPDPIRLQIGTSWDLRFVCSVDEVYANEFHASVPRHEADYALCAIDPLARRPELLEKIPPETIDLNGTVPDEQLLAAGYGCVTWTQSPSTGQVVFGPVRRLLTVGDFKVSEAQSLADAFTSLANAASESALCAGDSGGPAFRGPSVAQLGAQRRITGVASWVKPGTGIVRSRFASLGSARFKAFLACWLYKNRNSGIQLKQPINAPPVVEKPC